MQQQPARVAAPLPGVFRVGAGCCMQKQLSAHHTWSPCMQMLAALLLIGGICFAQSHLQVPQSCCVLGVGWQSHSIIRVYGA
jgi:hypothetical protein